MSEEHGPTTVRTPALRPSMLDVLARAAAFVGTWYAEVRAARARASASVAWAEADRWSAFAAVLRDAAERPSLRALAEALGVHLPPAKGTGA